MMKIRLSFILMTVLLMTSVGFCWAGPMAVPMDLKYEFAPIAEGQGLTHEFIIKNQGDTELSILGVIPP